MINAAWWVAKAATGTLVIMPWIIGARVLHTGGAACEAVAGRIEDKLFGQKFHD